MHFPKIFTSKYLVLFFLTLLLSGKLIAQTTITSNVTIDQNWITNNSTGPWTISTSSVTVTFGENLTITNTTQYFIITGSNVTINGAGKTATISGVTNYPGLVDASASNASSALIKNIGVITIGNTSLSEYQGYISRESNRAIILNCYSTGAISGYAVGGIAGLYNMGAISNCYSTGAISGDAVGGIAGPVNSGTISNCYTRGAISGNYAGGIEGIESSSNISNCYSTGAISGPFASGISGYSDSRYSNTYIGNGTWNSTDANAALTGEDGSIWNTSNTPYTLMPFVLSELTISTPIGTLTSNCAGVPSTPTTFGVNGSGLTTPVIISAPSNFEISTSEGGAYSSSLTLPQASTVSQTLYIRLSSSATTNGANGTITANSSSLTPATTTVSSTTVAAPLFAVSGLYTICSEGTYAVSLTVANSYNGWSTSSNAITVNNGYVTAGTVTGTYSVSYSDACAQTVSETVNVATTSSLPAITDGQAAYKFNNNPQGPLGSGDVIYMGYNGFNYSSQTRPINTGFYKANNISGSNAGCPYAFYIFSCTTCGTVSEYTTRPQGSLSGNSNGIGQLTYTSSNGGGPFTIVYQATGSSPVTVNNISSTVAFNVVTPTITTSYKLISVTDEITKATTDFSGTSASITVPPPHYVGQSYGGGIVFYVDGTGEHGLIAATSDISTGAVWGCSGTTITGADGTAIGTGNQNTIDIMAGCATAGIAARLCGDLVQEGYSDWYLPSKDELNQLFLNRGYVGGFANNLYWSSTEVDRTYARYQFFSNGYQNEVVKNYISKGYVRAIRAF